jgi:hypothetical protein
MPVKMCSCKREKVVPGRGFSWWMIESQTWQRPRRGISAKFKTSAHGNAVWLLLEWWYEKRLKPYLFGVGLQPRPSGRPRWALSCFLFALSPKMVFVFLVAGWSFVGRTSKENFPTGLDHREPKTFFSKLSPRSLETKPDLGNTFVDWLLDLKICSMSPQASSSLNAHSLWLKIDRVCHQDDGFYTNSIRPLPGRKLSPLTIWSYALGILVNACFIIRTVCVS